MNNKYNKATVKFWVQGGRDFKMSVHNNKKRLSEEIW